MASRWGEQVGPSASNDSQPGADTPAPTASVVIPAHNEANVIGRLLRSLEPAAGNQLEVIVACNGCTDDTAEVARATGVPTTVVELAEASKRKALERGDELAASAQRIYVDADVIIDASSVLALVAALQSGRHLAAAPRRRVELDGVGTLIRWYYDAWERLPAVQSGLFGRGVIALSRAGRERVRAYPALMGDDLVASEAFDPTERVVVDAAQSTIFPPRTVRDLVKRRARAATGNAQADQHELRRPESITSMRTLGSIVSAEPRMLPRVLIFLGVAVAARAVSWRAVRARDFETWQRDESSRR